MSNDPDYPALTDSNNDFVALAEDLQIHTPLDIALERIFGDLYKGGSSGPNGWSSRKVRMSCPYKYNLKRRIAPVFDAWHEAVRNVQQGEMAPKLESMLAKRRLPMPRQSEALEIGLLLHLLLGNYYQRQMISSALVAKPSKTKLVRCTAKCRAGGVRVDGRAGACSTCHGTGKIEVQAPPRQVKTQPNLSAPAFDPDQLRNQLLGEHVNAVVVQEAYRLYQGYEVEYTNEPIKPLAIEHHVEVDNISTRFDMIAEITPNMINWESGVWIVEHKTARAEDHATTKGWMNDGQIFGEILCYQRGGLAKKFGPLMGVIVNVVIKTKIPKFRRILVPVEEEKIRSHLKDLAFWDSITSICEATGYWPRNRSQCSDGRFGPCEFFDHCAGE